jgi:hypothetical protein
MHPCKKGHPHNTAEGQFKCDLKYADKRIKKFMDKGPIIYKKIVHSPARKTCKGAIEVVVFQEGELMR